MHVTGANGCGKSSLIRILAGLLRPFSGTVERDGSAGLVDERLALDEHMPMGRALTFWNALDDARGADAAIEAMQLSGLLDVPIRYLSTGQKKRAAIARLLSRKREIWLLDEPFNGLDREARGRLETLVGEHCGGGGIALIASHQPVSLPRLANLHLPDFSK